MSVNKALDNILEGNLDAMRTHFSNALSTKAIEKLEERKIDIAQSYFGQMMKEDQVEEDYDYSQKGLANFYKKQAKTSLNIAATGGMNKKRKKKELRRANKEHQLSQKYADAAVTGMKYKEKD
jgi:hypothetical protein